MPDLKLDQRTRLHRDLLSDGFIVAPDGRIDPETARQLLKRGHA